MVKTISHNVEIDVSSFFIERDSRPDNDFYFFGYTIIITNHSLSTIQLLSRFWAIIDGNGELRTVEGEGVIGLQPILKPGASHTYTSGCNFQLPIGKMRGYFIFEKIDSGLHFKVPISDFVMQYPPTLN